MVGIIFVTLLFVVLLSIVFFDYPEMIANRLNRQTIAFDDVKPDDISDFPFVAVVNSSGKRRYRRVTDKDWLFNHYLDWYVAGNVKLSEEKASRLIRFYQPWLADDFGKTIGDFSNAIDRFVQKRGINRCGIIYAKSTADGLRLFFTPISSLRRAVLHQSELIGFPKVLSDPFNISEYSEVNINKQYERLQKEITSMESLLNRGNCQESDYAYSLIRPQELKESLDKAQLFSFSSSSHSAKREKRKKQPMFDDGEIPQLPSDDDLSPEEGEVKTEENPHSDIDVLISRLKKKKDKIDTLRKFCDSANELCRILSTCGFGAEVKIELLNKELQLSPIDISVVNGSPVVSLPLYNKTISMPSLSLTLLVFFLRHTRGVKFKDLSDYRDELLDIYKAVSSRTDNEQLKKSIDDLVDPTSNSLNEKCARLKAAFCQALDNSIAKNYYITGPRSDLRRIALPPELININI